MQQRATKREQVLTCLSCLLFCLIQNGIRDRGISQSCMREHHVTQDPQHMDQNEQADRQQAFLILTYQAEIKITKQSQNRGVKPLLGLIA